MRSAAEHDHAVARAIKVIDDMTAPGMTAQKYSLHTEPAPKPERAGILGLLVAFAIIAAAVAGLLASIHETTERACPTMDSACQIVQESPE